MTSEELFNQSIKPMSNRQQIILQSKAIDILESKTLTREVASDLIGMKHPEGIIIGITTKPGLQYPEGTYITISNFDKPSKHIRVG